MNDVIDVRVVSYAQLMAMVEDKGNIAKVSTEILELFGRSSISGEHKRCAAYISRALKFASATLTRIQKGRDTQDKSLFLNSDCGLATYLGATVALPPIPVAAPLAPLLPPPLPVTASHKAPSVECGSCAVHYRKIRNLTAQLKRARRWKKLSLGLKCDSKKQNNVGRLNSKIKFLSSSNRAFSRDNSSLRGTVATRTAEIVRLATELRFSENARLEAEESLAKLNSRVVTLFDGKKYSSDTVVTVIALLDQGVADEKVGPVMELVAKLTGVKLDRVPCASTVGNIAVASLSVAKAHVHTVLDQAIERGEQLCLYSDETNKLGSKLQLFGAGLVKGDGGQEIILFGLAQVADKSAETAFNIMRKRLGSLSGAVENSSKWEQFIDRFFAAVTCTMSDRAATQQKFNEMFVEYRNSVLPKVISGWENMSDAQRQRSMTFHVFYCQLHVIANYTNVVLEALAEHERLVTGEEVPALSPTVFTVVKEVARFFGDRSAGMHGSSKEFKVWSDLDQTNCKSPFPSFYGHRFNVVFYLGSRVFCHSESLQKFIRERGAGRSELIKLGELLALPIVNEHLQILGLLDQLVTGPLWRLAENVAHVMDTTATVSLLLSWVRECRDIPLSMFSGNCSVPSLHSIAAGDEQFLEKLLSLTPSETSLEAVSLVMESSLRYFEHLFEDFTTGGKYSGVVDDVVMDRTRCASATNRFIESGFGFVDRLFNHAPNMCISRREARLLVSKNHTMTWLTSLKPEVRQAIVSAARASIRRVRAEAAQAKKLLGEAILQKSLEKERGYNAKCALQVQRRNQAVDAINPFGFINSINGISALLVSSSATARANALAAQIRFRERALHQPPPEKKIYVLSCKGKRASEAELKRRLIVLIEADQKGALLTSSLGHPYTGRTIRRWEDEAHEDGEISAVEKRGETTLVTLKFPSREYTLPLPQLESDMDEGLYDFFDIEL